MTAVDQELDIKDLFDFDIQCGWFKNRPDHDDCENPAKWVISTICCKEMNFMCDEHLAEFNSITARHMYFIVCAHCKAEHITVDDWVTIAPI